MSLKQNHCILSFESNICWVLSAMLSHFSHVLLFVTLWTVDHQVPRSVGFSRQEYWSGLPCPSSKDLPKWLNLCLLRLLHWSGCFFLFVCLFVFVFKPLAPAGKLWYLVASMHVHDYKWKLHGYWCRLSQWRR